MKINAQITMLASGDGLSIEVMDKDSRARFLHIKLTPEQFSQALGRLAYTECESAEVFQLDKVGMAQEWKEFVFPVCDGEIWLKNDLKERAKESAAATCPDGWQPDLYFSSQDSFFTKDGTTWARTTIRRWVEKEGGEK